MFFTGVEVSKHKTKSNAPPPFVFGLPVSTLLPVFPSVRPSLLQKGKGGPNVCIATGLPLGCGRLPGISPFLQESSLFLLILYTFIHDLKYK